MVCGTKPRLGPTAPVDSRPAGPWLNLVRPLVRLHEVYAMFTRNCNSFFCKINDLAALSGPIRWAVNRNLLLPA